MHRFHRHAIPALLIALLVACTAPGPAPQASAAMPPAAAPDLLSPSPADHAQRKPARLPRMSAPPPQRVRDDPAVVDGSCKTDADCTVQDVGSCCGYHPACVNKDSPTDPRGVKAQCANSGMASVCGFREISACTCNAGTCQVAGGGAPVAQ